MARLTHRELGSACRDQRAECRVQGQRDEGWGLCGEWWVGGRARNQRTNPPRIAPHTPAPPNTRPANPARCTLHPARWPQRSINVRVPQKTKNLNPAADGSSLRLSAPPASQGRGPTWTPSSSLDSVHFGSNLLHWWRRGESNPGPQGIPSALVHVRSRHIPGD